MYLLGYVTYVIVNVAKYIEQCELRKNEMNVQCNEKQKKNFYHSVHLHKY